ncbi:MAG TPA: trehalose-6-phosphate synthase [Burkholderiales bacterium]|nr:trehalose-6-phosphate synthase [Burkholderiales bacterium]
MRLSLRFILPLAITLAAIAYAVVPLVDRLTLQWFVRDLDIRTSLITRTIQEPLSPLVREGSRIKVLRYFDRLIQDERLFAVGFCSPEGKLLYKTITFPASLGCAIEPAGAEGDEGQVVNLSRGPVHVSNNALEADGKVYGRLVLVHDMSFVQRRSDDTKKYVFYLFAAMAAIVSLVTVVIAEVSWRGWVAGLKAVIRGETFGFGEAKVRIPELRPVARDLRALIKELESERKARDESQINWSAETLRAILRNDLKGEEVLIVSNREPYIHVHRDKRIEVQRPASGLVTALEPVMRACSGTWIAHGGGSADRETVDATDHIHVPPERPAYRIRRVWLSQEEEAGYYYGFSNSGLWPLCHIAHTRPVFRTADWNAYVTVNRRFADAVVNEAKTEDPIVLVQDYHFALLPRMIRERIPAATVISFWHIPWPNAEAFGICPWREELIDGILGSSILGFHTQFHCNNFIDTVDRYVEARIDRESFTVSYGGDQTAVRRYPISIEWPLSSKTMQKPVAQCRARVREDNGLAPDTVIGVGVDRLDYTKGILERFLAVERLLEVDPLWIGKFVFVQIAAPSRSSIDEYQDFDTRVRALARRINERFSGKGHLPILLKVEHHDPDEVYEYYRAADVCFVSSLHDGMNLVAKEFVASRDDERGVLILSQFTGASRELPEALIVNPYDIDQCAAALRAALMMPPAEQRDRMRSMRGLVEDFNVYRWAGRMLLDAGQMRMRSRLLSRTRERKPLAVRAV